MSNDNVHLGHRARKRFGQNFLHDPYIIGEIVRAIRPENGQHLVEIGPGLAALTEPVLDEIDHLTVLELDRDLAARLRTHPKLGQRLTVLEGDAMRFDFRSLQQSPLRIFGNLPYNISTPLMFHLFSYAELISDMHFMLQKEVVERLAAAPNSKTYGRLTVMAQYHCQIIPVLEVPPESFRPAPKVNSAVVRLIPHRVKPFIAHNEALLESICAEAFNQRRKTIRNALQNRLTADDLTALGLDGQLRPENLTLENYVTIANYVHDQRRLHPTSA